jgi:hypothetical protein
MGNKTPKATLTEPVVTVNGKDYTHAELQAILARSQNNAGTTPEATPPKPPSGDFVAMECIYTRGRYPKLGLMFTNGSDTITKEKYDELQKNPFFKQLVKKGEIAPRGKLLYPGRSVAPKVVVSKGNQFETPSSPATEAQQRALNQEAAHAVGPVTKVPEED